MTSVVWTTKGTRAQRIFGFANLTKTKCSPIIDLYWYFMNPIRQIKIFIKRKLNAMHSPVGHWSDFHRNIDKLAIVPYDFRTFIPNQIWDVPYDYWYIKPIYQIWDFVRRQLNIMYPPVNRLWDSHSNIESMVRHPTHCWLHLPTHCYKRRMNLRGVVVVVQVLVR